MKCLKTRACPSNEMTNLNRLFIPDFSLWLYLWFPADDVPNDATDKPSFVEKKKKISNFLLYLLHA